MKVVDFKLDFRLCDKFYFMNFCFYFYLYLKELCYGIF